MPSYPIERGYLQRPGCRVYYEVTGSGPAIVLAHGLGSNHMTWWQQVAHFRARFKCVTYSHRGYPPGSEIPGGPDPNDYGADLAALIDALRMNDVRLIAQSMGGVSALEYMLSFDHCVRALVLTSTCGTIQKSAIPLDDPRRLADWQRDSAAARAEMQRRAIAPPAIMSCISINTFGYCACTRCTRSTFARQWSSIVYGTGCPCAGFQHPPFHQLP